jgi:type II secretory pathway component PulJ
MRELLANMRRRLGAEEGFSLAELLMAATISLLIVSAGTMMFTTAVRSQTGLSSRDHAIQQGRTAMERMIREIRQGGAVEGSPTAQSLSFATFVAGSTICVGGQSDQYAHKPCVVTYSCASSGTCTRRERNPYTGTQGSAVQIVSGLATPNVFEYRSDPSTECQPPPDVSSEAVSVRDEATLRNSDPESLSRVCVSFVFPKA